MVSSKLFKVALTFFLISAVLGVLLRMTFFHPIAGLNYKFLLHTHSHIVLLGWITNALIAMLYYVFFESKGIQSKTWIGWFVVLQLSVVVIVDSGDSSVEVWQQQ